MNIQWASYGNGEFTYIQSLPISFNTNNLVTFATNNNRQGTYVDNSFGYSINVYQSYVATKPSGTNAEGTYGTNILVLGY